MTTIANPFAGRKLSARSPLENLHPAGTFFGTILEPSIGNAQSSGALTLRVPVLSDFDAGEGRIQRRLYKYFVFTGEGAEYTDAFIASMDIDISESGEDWRSDLLAALHGRRVQLHVLRSTISGQPQVRVRTLEGNEQTFEQERALARLNEHEDDLDDEFGDEEDDDNAPVDLRTAVAVA